MNTTGEARPSGATAAGPLTVAQFAEPAGTSMAMVSKVVNGRTDVAGETRAGRPSADGAQGPDRKTVRRYAHAAPPRT
ncbi:hypothetical protein QF034_000111 [Streptomyces africanus]|uniref:LacI family transcriptional regulator n=1 Tax=Streptomyces africanus TaxID=231024 RepID=A0ABU0QER6_9ACTN|nr:hypothetical protein [Streptomyces africanus]MDQ0745880.1 hypothetical protein [Streptomyces africanus]